jgi:hypothetical protein
MKWFVVALLLIVYLSNLSEGSSAKGNVRHLILSYHGSACQISFNSFVSVYDKTVLQVKIYELNHLCSNFIRRVLMFFKYLILKDFL